MTIPINIRTVGAVIILLGYCYAKAWGYIQMDLNNAIFHLKKFQEWRRYDGDIRYSPAMPNPAITGEALDIAINILEGLKNDKTGSQ